MSDQEARVVLVPANAKILNDPATQKLYEYPDGSILIRTTAPVDEAGESVETPVQQGVKLEGVNDDDLHSARATLAAEIHPILPGPAPIEPIIVAGPILAYVELIGPVIPQWLNTLKELGVQPLHYQPQNSYLCKGKMEAFREVSKQNFVLHVTPLTNAMKPKLDNVKLAEEAMDVLLVVQGTQNEAADIIKSLSSIPDVEIPAHQAVEQVGSYLRIRARVTADSQNALLKNPLVQAIDPYQNAVPEDEVAGLILAGQYTTVGSPSGSYLQWLEDHGITGEGITIGIVDNGVDASHAAFNGRIHDLTNGKKSWHGTFVAGHAAGNYLLEKDGDKFIYGLGTAPKANILVQDNSDTATNLCQQTVTEKGPAGIAGSVQNNSWGKGTQDPMDYRSDEHTYDQLVRNADPAGNVPKPLMICFSSGNSGKGGLTRPKAAKNVIITGNSENYRPAIGGDESDNINEVYQGPHASSWGNCADQRIRPHIVAPGEWTSAANYDSHEGEKEYISPQMTWGGGSSGASPKTAGACALLIHWWRQHNAGKDPSPALLRALLVNGAEPLLTGGSIPNMQQGWGRLNVGNIVTEAVEHTYVDQTVLFTLLGQQKVWNIAVSDPKKALKITLAWTDPGGPLQSGTAQVDAIVNKLGLTADINGVLYRGGWRQDQFQSGWSVADGSPEPSRVDNLQNIFLQPNAVNGIVKVTVKVVNITTNCMTGEIDTPQQDFALVISNGRLDGSSNPADVLVAVDKAAKSDSKPATPDNYWKSPQNNNDAQATQAGWWQDTTTTANGKPAPAATSSTTSENDWWNQADGQWSKPETERGSENTSFLQDATFARGLKAGLDLLTMNGSTRSMLGKGGAKSEATPEVIRDGDLSVQTSEAELAETLATLMTNWESFGVSASNENLMRRRCAVLVVGSGTRVALEDIDAMRRLTFMGELYLLSDDPALLAFLAQRIHRQTGIQYRLATSVTELAQLLRDTLAEVAGAQLMAVHSTTTVTEAGVASKHLFLVVDSDMSITLRLHHAMDAPIKEIKLQRPGQDELPVAVHDSGGVHVIQEPEAIQLIITSTQDKQYWAGQWTLSVLQQVQTVDKAVVVNAWGQGGPNLLFREQPLLTNDTRQDGQNVLVVLSGQGGVSLSRSVISPPRLATVLPVAGTEDEKDLVLAVRPSRIDSESASVAHANGARPEAEAIRTLLLAPSLSQQLQIPRVSTGATVLDLPIQSLGIDAHGQLFARMTRTNLIRLEARSLWRQRMIEQQTPQLISAQIVEVHYDAGKVIALSLRKGDKQRTVTVSSPMLRDELAHLGLNVLQGKNWQFKVAGDELIGLLHMLGGGTESQTITLPPGEDHGIEAPLPVHDVPKQEDDPADYPQATRFMAAASYRQSTSVRTINRVVIHITADGASIDGTISWFQNPASKVSAHYVVGQDGEVVQMVRDNDIAYHAHGANGDSIGIEHCARPPKTFNSSDPGLYPTAIQYAASAALVRWACDQYSIPIDRDHVLGHSEADPQTTHTNCPNAVWNWDYFMNMVTNAMSLPPPQ